MSHSMNGKAGPVMIVVTSVTVKTATIVHHVTMISVSPVRVTAGYAMKRCVWGVRVNVISASVPFQPNWDN